MSNANLDHDVVVVGAGPAGLVAAARLAHHGVDVLVIDKRRDVSTTPRAVGVSLRQMEVFRTWGLEDQLRAGAADVDLALLETATAADAAAGTRLDLNFPDARQSAVVSPTAPARVPQDHLERVLVDHLAGLPSCRVLRRREVTDLVQDDHGVRLILRVDGSTEPHEVTASYVVATDGAHSTVRTRLGIEPVGPTRAMAGVTAEFRAPLWAVLGEHRYALYGIRGPEGAGVLIPAGPDDRWQYGVTLGPDEDPAPLVDRAVLSARIRAAAGVPDLPVWVTRTGTFVAGAQLATQFSSGRVFLAGDAAHRVTPRGGNGLAMAVRDGLALGWRLGWVLRGWAPASFLDGYEREMRPLAAVDVARSADPEGRCHAVISEMLHDLGGRMPHAWTGPGDPEGGPVSTLDLVGDGLTLFTRTGAPHWRAAAEVLGADVLVTVAELPETVAHALGLTDPAAALLVRPDAVPVARWQRTADTATALSDLRRAVDDLVGPVPALVR